MNHGFRKGFSCETQLLVTMDDLLKHYDRNTQIDVIILDFSKAFDTVPHKKLLNKLEGYGINGSIFKWIDSFLTQRKMCVAVDGEFAEWTPVLSGVPQGDSSWSLAFSLSYK